MKINACTIKNLYGIAELALNFVDPATGTIRQRTVIAGSNGSGKTTILRVIGQMLALVKLQRLEWVDFGEATIQLLVSALPSAQEPLLTIEIAPDRSKVRIAYEDGKLERVDNPAYAIIQSGDVEIVGQAAQLYTAIQAAEKNGGDFPNCIYLPSENRQLHKKKAGQVLPEQTPYQWVYRFNDSQQWPGSLESFLVAMHYRDLQGWYDAAQNSNGHGHKAQRKGEFAQFVETINRFLADKQLYGVNRQTFRVQVQAHDGQMQSLDDLSSGEKQIILLLGEIQRHLQHGSIVLIDEPEIHLHPKWQRQLMQALTDLCSAYDAQLIVTTHSEEIANSVYAHELVLLDDIFASAHQPASRSL